MQQRFSAYFFCSALLLLLVAAICRTVLHPLESDPSWLDGKATLKLEKSFEKNLPFEAYVKPLWGILNYGIFQTTGNGAVVGENGWFYTAEEFEIPKNFDANIQNNLDYISEVNTTLLKQDIKLLVVLIPAKTRIYPEYLGIRKMPAQRQELYSHVQKALQDITAVDGFSAFQKAKPNAQLFLRTDTHWTPEGAEVMAKAIADTADLELPGTEFQTTKSADTKKHSGDLAKFSQTGKFKSLFPELTETRNQYQTANTSQGDLFGDATIPVALVGTSYSAQEKWNFTGFLQQELQADVMNVADEGGGPIGPMRKFIKEVLPQNPGIKLVIWEFPERFFPVDYKEEAKQ